MMDWNVISDKPGDCPLCGMKLNEVTLDQAEKNLEKNGFKIIKQAINTELSTFIHDYFLLKRHNNTS